MKNNKFSHPYWFSAALTFGVAVFGAIAGLMEFPWLFIVPLVGLVAWSDARKLLISFEFSSVLLTVLTVLVIFGTLFHKMPMFSAYWFMGLMGMMGLSSTLCVVFKFNKRRGFAYLIIHASIVVILLGSLVKFLYKEEAYIHIMEGQTVEYALKMDGAKITEEPVELPFNVRLNKFDVEFYESTPTVYVFEHDKEGPSAALNVNNQDAAEVAGVKIKVLGMREHPFVPRPDHPPIQVKMAELEVGGKRGMVMEGRPVRDGNLAFKFVESQGDVKVYRSDLSLLDDSGNELQRKKIVVNDPIIQDGWWLYQSNWNPQNHAYSGIQLVKDPGLVVVFIGLILLALGTLLKVRFKRSEEATS